MDEAIATRLGKLHVWRAGTGSPVVFWPSLYVDRRSALPVAEALSADHDVVIIEGPGHGRSPAAGRRYTMDECALAAGDVLDALSLPVVDWVGNAWGGHVGVALSRLAPQRLRSLVAICSPLQPLDAKGWALGQALLGLYGLFGPDRVVERIADTLVLRDNATARAYVVEVFKGADRAGMSEAIASVMIGRTSLEGPIPVRALLVSTEKNALVGPDLLRAQAAAAGAQAKVLSGSKHLPLLEEPEAVTALLREWLQASTST